jgi:predicted trehalose synthase
MLRSLSYAAAVGASESGAPLDAAQAWERRNRDAFLDAYLDAMHGSPLLPSSPSATQRLLHAFELDKAVYEVGYEQAHRPDWIDVPLAGVSALLRT